MTFLRSNNGGQSSTSTHRQHDHAVSAATVVREAAKTSALSQQRTSDISSAKQDMLAAIADISQWSFTHKLKLNSDKSEVIWLGSRQQLAKLSEADKSLQLPDGLVRSSTTVKNLGWSKIDASRLKLTLGVKRPTPGC